MTNNHQSTGMQNHDMPGIAADWLIEALRQRRVPLNIAINELGLGTNYNFLPFDKYNTLFEWAAIQLNDKCLGIHIAEELDLTRWGIFGYLLLNSATLDDWCKFAERYLAIFQRGAKLTYSHRQGICECRYEIFAPNIPNMCQDVEFSLALPILFIRRQLGSQWVPDAVFFKHTQPQDLSCHRAVFGDNLHFDCGFNGFNFDEKVLKTKISDADPRLLLVLQSQANQILSQIEEKPDLIKHVKLLITASLGGKYLGSEEVAGQLNMTSRTLHRHLEAHETSFQALRNDILVNAAKEALTTTNATITEIALKLSYSESSAFTRAFKHLVGVSPLQYRKMHDGAKQS